MRRVALSAIRPGDQAQATQAAIGGATATSRFFAGPSLNSDGKHFGSFGVIGALLAWTLVIVTLSMVCAVFSPVWAEWRASETESSP